MNPVVVYKEQAGTGGLEAASRLSRETALWNPSLGSPDQILNGVKAIIDARSNDTAQNDAWASSAVTTHRDAIVGAKYALNCKPDTRMLGLDIRGNEAHSDWYEEFQAIVEARWNAAAESDACWLDVARRRTVTEMCRQAVSSIVLSGEILCAAEWDTSSDRPFRTCAHLISPARLSNMNGGMDTRYLRRGIEMDFYGRHLAYHIRQGHPGEGYDARSWQWRRVPATLPWGRKQMLYIAEPLLVEQTRGVGDMSSALPHMRMAKKHSEIALQKAVVGATYAMALKSGLPPPEIAVMMGATPGGQVTAEGLYDGWQNAIGNYLRDVVLPFYSNSQNAAIDGAKGVVLPPGTELQMLNADNGGGASYAEFEAGLNRKTAAALNMSYEEFTRDYSRVSYSGAKASAGKTERFMNSRKKLTADRLAGGLFTLWLEEQIALGEVPLPPTWTSRDDYYRPMMKEAISRSDWIGTGKGQIDELKETQAAAIRIKTGLSTRGIECARLGNDFRDIAEDLAREDRIIADLGLTLTTDAERSTDGAGTQATLQDETTGAGDDE